MRIFISLILLLFLGCAKQAPHVSYLGTETYTNEEEREESLRIMERYCAPDLKPFIIHEKNGAISYVCQ